MYEKLFRIERRIKSEQGCMRYLQITREDRWAETEFGEKLTLFVFLQLVVYYI